MYQYRYGRHKNLLLCYFCATFSSNTLQSFNRRRRSSLSAASSLMLSVATYALRNCKFLSFSSFRLLKQRSQCAHCIYRETEVSVDSFTDPSWANGSESVNTVLFIKGCPTSFCTGVAGLRSSDHCVFQGEDLGPFNWTAFTQHPACPDFFVFQDGFPQHRENSKLENTHYFKFKVVKIIRRYSIPANLRRALTRILTNSL